MEAKNYYYLISGLPDLVLEQNKAPFSLPELTEELRSSLHPQDFSLVEWIFLPHDNFNLLNLLGNKDLPWDTLGRFSREELEEKLKDPGLLPSYMYQFAQAFKDGVPIVPEMSRENQLSLLYYQFVIGHTTGFLQDWFTFERDLKNILAAWNAREYGYSAEGQLIGDNEVVKRLQNGHTRDFGLSRDVEFMDRLISALEKESLAEREKAVDRIRWNVIDTLNTFHYFTAEVVFGYLLKFIILDRWLNLDEEKGRKMIEESIQVLEKRIEFIENRL